MLHISKGPIILGINCLGSYDTSAAIIVEGEIVAAVEEERLNRFRFTADFPIKSINYCLKKAGVTMNDVDCIAVAGDPARYIFEFFLPLSIRHPHSNSFSRNMEMIKKHYKIENNIREITGYKGPIRFHIHHMCHWASVFYPSDSQESAILSLDGVGESQCVVMGIASNKEFHQRKEVCWPNSLGVLYNGITHWCGFDHKNVGKTMGLAGYGKPSHFIELFDQLIRLHNDGTFELDPDCITFGFERNTWFRGKFLEAIRSPRKPDSEITQKEKDLAYAIQKSFEKTVLHMLTFLHEATKLEEICIVGGGAYNCLTNGLILKKTGFKRLHVQPAAGDAGISIGAALYDYHQHFPNAKRKLQVDTYLGPEYSNDEILLAIRSANLEYEFLNDPSRIAAQLLAKKEIIGWFQGRMEFGPRALGNRSILSPPFPAEMKDNVNRNIKHREVFRPFAPAVVEEKYDDYFEPCGNAQYMLVATKVKQEKAAMIPAVIHIDGTVRVQSVSHERNPRFYNLIKIFGEITGIYVILNTSFNDKGMPIVCSPQDAIQCFFQTGLTNLIMGNYLIKKP